MKQEEGEAQWTGWGRQRLGQVGPVGAGVTVQQGEWASPPWAEGVYEPGKGTHTRPQQERRGETRLPDPGGSRHRVRGQGLRELAEVWPEPRWGGVERKAGSGGEKWAQERNHSSGAKVRHDHRVPKTGS